MYCSYINAFSWRVSKLLDQNSILSYSIRSACTIPSLKNGETGPRTPLHRHAFFSLFFSLHACIIIGCCSASAAYSLQCFRSAVSHTYINTRVRVHKLRINYLPPCTHKHTQARAPSSKACRIHACTKQDARVETDQARALFHVRWTDRQGALSLVHRSCSVQAEQKCGSYLRGSWRRRSPCLHTDLQCMQTRTLSLCVSDRNASFPWAPL